MNMAPTMPYVAWTVPSKRSVDVSVQFATTLLRGAGWYVNMLKPQDGESAASGADVHVSPTEGGDGWTLAIHDHSDSREEYASAAEVVSAILRYQYQRFTWEPSARLDPASFEDACIGSIVGLAVGDALGLHVENAPVEKAHEYVARLEEEGGLKAMGAPWRAGGGMQEMIIKLAPELPAGQVSDDTQCTLALSESLLEKGSFDPASFLKFLAAKHAGKPLGQEQKSGIVGQGSTSRAALNSNQQNGDDWLHAGRGSETSTSNGSCMRVGPLGLFLAAAGDPSSVTTSSVVTVLAHASSHVTHHGVACKEGAAAIVAAIAAATRTRAQVGSDGNRVRDVEALRISVLAAVEAQSKLIVSTVRAMLNAADEDTALVVLHSLIPGERSKKEVAVSGKTLGATDVTDGVTMHASQTAAWGIFAFLRSPNKFWETVLVCVRAGGDTDTVAAVAGALSGSWVGLAGILQERPDAGALLDRLQDTSEDSDKAYVERLKKIGGELASVACAAQPPERRASPTPLTMVWGSTAEAPSEETLKLQGSDWRVVKCTTDGGILSTTTSVLKASGPFSVCVVVPSPEPSRRDEGLQLLRRLRVLGAPTVVHSDEATVHVSPTRPKLALPRLMQQEWARHVTPSAEDAARMAARMLLPPRVTEQPKKVIIIGLSGSSKSGKTSMCNSLLQDVGEERFRGVHLDDFFDTRRTGVSVPFAPETLGLRTVLKGFQLIGSRGNFDSPGSIAHETALSSCREALETLSKVGTEVAPAVLAVDGHMSLFDPALMDMFDLILWLDVGLEEARRRRMASKKIPGEYYDKCLWPNYLEYRRKCVEEPLKAGLSKVEIIDAGQPQAACVATARLAIERHCPQLPAKRAVEPVAEPEATDSHTAQPVAAEPVVAKPAADETKTTGREATDREVDAELTAVSPETAEPTAAEPAVVESAVAEFAASETAADEPAIAKPEVVEPTVVEPAVSKPVAATPETVELAVAELAVAELAVAEPAVAEPAVAEPVADAPETVASAAAEPAVAEPTVAEPAATAKPEVVEPAVAEPVAAASEPVESAAAEPAVAEVEVADSAIAKPEVVEPTVVAPAVAEAVAAAPETDASAAPEPAVAEPAVSEPAVIEHEVAAERATIGSETVETTAAEPAERTSAGDEAAPSASEQASTAAAPEL